MTVIPFPTPASAAGRQNTYRIAFRPDLSVEAQGALVRLREQLDREMRGLLDERYRFDQRSRDWIVTEVWSDD